MKKTLSVCIFLSILASCGNEKIVNAPATSTVSNSNQSRSLLTEGMVDEVTCIDDVLSTYSHSSGFISKIVENTDITFCNGKRLRLKVYKLSNNEHLALGYLDGLSKVRCLRSDIDFKKKPLIGYDGTLKGLDVKVGLGGFSYDGKKLQKSKKLKEKHVRFDLTSFKGGMSIFEDDKLACWETSD